MTRILVIDDDEDVRLVLREILQAASYETLEAQDGAQGLALMRESPCDLVITDVYMPGKDGFETVMELREQHPDVKVIAISGGNVGVPMDLLPVAAKFGAHLTLHKPITWQDLLAAVAGILS